MSELRDDTWCPPDELAAARQRIVALEADAAAARKRVRELEAALAWRSEPAPKDGQKIEVQRSHEVWRWVKYRPGAPKPQLKRGGRWQRMVWHGDFFKWENAAGEPESWRPLGPGPESDNV